MQKKPLLYSAVGAAVIIAAGVATHAMIPRASPSRQTPMAAIIVNTEDTPLETSFAGADLVAGENAFINIVQSEWPAGSPIPAAVVSGGLVDLDKAGQITWLSGNLISLNMDGAEHDIWVSVPPDAPSGQAGNEQISGSYGRPVQTTPDWWMKGFFIPSPSDAPYLLSESDLINVPVIPPAAVRYQPIRNPQSVVAWLAARDSAEAGTQYLNMLDQAGKKYNLNPLLLLAITGQEQSFVPKFLGDWPQVLKNPFNVYYSWQDYAPGFLQAAMIAAETVNHLSSGCPPGMNPIEWVDSPANPNDRYAGDTDWWKGVSVFFSILQGVGD